MAKTERDAILADFRRVANIQPAKLAKWLASDKSKSVGWANGKHKTASGGTESIGHISGRKIIAIKKKKKDKLTTKDLKHMKKVVAYVKRHRKQRPAGDITDTRWRYSLMNWGHDPTKE